MKPTKAMSYRLLTLVPAAVPKAASWQPTDEPEPRPTVWQTADHTGTLRWNVFDPGTGRTTFALSETQLQAWLKNWERA